MADALPRILRLFLSAPIFAEDERQRIEQAVAEITAAFRGQVDLATVAPGTAGAAECDAVIAIFRATPPPGYQAGDQPAGGGAAGMLSAIGGRAAGAKMPDIFVFRHVQPGTDDPDWENRQTAFRAWYDSRGGEFLSFADYDAADALGTDLSQQLYSWLAREGLTPLVAVEPEAVALPEAFAFEPPIVDEPTADVASPGDPEESEAAPAETLEAGFLADDPAAGISVPDDDGMPAEYPQAEQAVEVAPIEPQKTLEPVLFEDETAADIAGPYSETSPEGPDTTSDFVETVEAAPVEPVEALDTLVVEDTAAADLAPPDEPEQAETGEPEQALTFGFIEAEQPEAKSGKRKRKGKREKIADDAAIEATETAAEIDAQAHQAPESQFTTEGDAGTDGVEPVPDFETVPDLLAEEFASEQFEPTSADAPAEAAEDSAPVFEEAAPVPAEEIVEPAAPDEPRPDDTTVEAAEGEIEQTEPTTPIVGGPLWSSFAADAAPDEPEPEGEPAPAAEAHRSAEILPFGPRDQASPIHDHEPLPLDDTAYVIEDGHLFAGAQDVQGKPRRRSIPPILASVAIVAIAAGGVAGWQWWRVNHQRQVAEKKINVAADAASSLVFDLNQKLRNQSGGNPDADSAALLDRAQKLQDAIVAADTSNPKERADKAATLSASTDALLKQGNTDEALRAATQARDIYRGLAKGDAGNPDWLANLATNDAKIGDMLITQDAHIEDALSAYREAFATSKALAAQHPDDLQRQRDLAENNNRLGDALMAQGHLDEAAAAYREGLAIATAQAQKDPANGDWQHALSASQERSGNVLMAQGHADDALAAYKNALATAKALIQKEPNNDKWQQDLSARSEKIGNALVAQGHPAEALAAYRDGLAIRKTLAQKDPSDVRRQQAVASSQQEIGDVAVVQGGLEPGLAAYREALAARKALAAKAPGNADLQRDVMTTDDAIGDVLAAQTKLDDALAVYKESYTLANAMAGKYPADPRWQQAASRSDDKIGDVLVARGRPDDALGVYREGLILAKALAAKEPGNTDWQRLVATNQERIGDIFAAENHFDSALAAYREDMDILRAMMAKEPANVLWQHGMAEGYLRVGSVLFDQGHLDDSIDAHRQALTIAQALAKSDPANARWQRDLMLDNSKVGQLLMARGNREDALVNYRDALAVAKTMGDKDQSNAEWQANRAMIESNIGALQMGLGNSDDALVAYRDGLTVAKALAMRDAHNVEWQTGLVIALYNLAEAGDDRTANFTQALDILKKLDAAGTLPPGKKEWIAKIEGKLGKMKRPGPAEPVAPSQAAAAAKTGGTPPQKAPPKHQPKHSSQGG